MKRIFWTACAVAAILGVCVGAFARAEPAPVRMPVERAELKQAPDVEIARDNCTGCHSADYISTQPHGPKFRDEFWKAEVNKMIKVYGAPIDQADVGRIVDYLTRAYAE